jgi:uncharacterized protein with FMN-binding domain
VRKQTRLTLGVVGLSALTTSYLLGHQATESSIALTALGATAEATSTPSETATETQVTSPATTETATAEATATAEPSATAKPSPSQTATSEPTATQTQAPAASSNGTYKSQTLQYRYGQIQLEIAVTDGALTHITLLKATTEGRGYDQAPPILVDAALQAGGTSFGNLSGATFTTQAFKQALGDALSQAGLN